MHAFPDQNAPTTEERTDANASNSGRSNDSSVAIPRAIAEPDSWVETMLYPIAKQAFKGNPLLIILGSHGLGKSTLAQKVAFARGDEGTRRLVINVRESRASLELIEQRIAGLAGSEVAQTVLVLDDVRDDLITPLVRQFRSLGQSPLIGLIIVGHAWAQPMRSEHAIRLEPLLEDDARALLTRHLEAGKSKPRFDDLVAAIMRTAGRHPRLMLGYTEQLRTAWLAASFDAESHIKKLNSSAGMGGHDQAPVYDEVEKMISLIQDHKPLALALVRLSCFVGPFNEAAAMAVLDGAPDAFEHVRGWLDEVKLGNGIIEYRVYDIDKLAIEKLCEGDADNTRCEAKQQAEILHARHQEVILKQLSEDYLSTDRHEQVAGDLSRRLPDVAEAFSRVCALADTDVGDTIIANLLEQGFRVFHRLLPYNERVNIGNGVTSREGMSDLTLMRAHHLMGSGLACQAKATEAAEHYVKAQAALDRVVERYPDRLADELRLRSDQAWRLNDERRYDEAKVKFEAAYAKEDWLQFDGLTFSLLDGLLPLVDGLGSAWLHCEKPDAWKALWFFEQGLSMIRHVCGTGVVHHYVGVCLRGVGEACTILYEQLRQQAEAARAQGEPHQALEGKAEEYAARARRDLVESLAFAEERGPRTHVALSKHGLGRLLHERGEHAAARAMLQGALQVCHETNWTLLRLEVLEDLTCNCLDEARKLGQERNALAKKCKSGGVHLMVEAYLEFADGLQDTPRWRANDGSKTDEVV